MQSFKFTYRKPISFSGSNLFKTCFLCQLQILAFPSIIIIRQIKKCHPVIIPAVIFTILRIRHDIFIIIKNFMPAGSVQVMILFQRFNNKIRKRFYRLGKEVFKYFHKTAFICCHTFCSRHFHP